MRIAFISYEYPPDTGKGGIGTYVQQIALALAAYGWDVHVFCAGHNSLQEHIGIGFTLHKIKADTVQDFVEKVGGQFEIIHAIHPFDLMESPEINGNALSIKKKWPKIPMVVRLHAPNQLVEGLKKRYIPFQNKLRFVMGALRRGRFDPGYWKAYNKEIDPDYLFTLMADFITAPSEAMKHWAIKNWGLRGKEVTVIPNPFVPSTALLELPIPTEAQFKTIVFFGRLNVLKGLVNATTAVRKVLQKHKDWHFLIIGDDGPGPKPGSTMKAWMSKAFAEVKHHVTFTNGVAYTQLPSVIANSEIVVLPSLFESFSYACAEAMSAGKAVVGSKNGGMAGLINHNENGMLVDPESADEIFEAVDFLIRNDKDRFRYATNARRSMLENNKDNKTAKKFDAYYKKILAVQH